MTDYFRAVTLGAFTWKDKERIALFFTHIQKMKSVWFLLHFLLLTFCLNFPVTLAIARLSPLELYTRMNNAPESINIDEFNLLMIQNGYGTHTLLPLLGLGFGLIFVIQAAFYLSAVFFVGLARMSAATLSFHDRLGLAIFSSTLPVLIAAIFGLFMPTVHIIIFYFMVMFLIFQRSKCYISCNVR